MHRIEANILHHAKKQREQRKYFNSCNRCCFDLKDDDGDILEHYCIDNKLYIPPIN
jgi:hypothetical protein